MFDVLVLGSTGLVSYLDCLFLYKEFYYVHHAGKPSCVRALAWEDVLAEDLVEVLYPLRQAL